MIILPDKDALGQAINDYYCGVEYAAIAVFSTIDDNYFLEANELFRQQDQFSDIDQHALNLCKGKVIDVGAGAGSHSLYLQNKNIDCTALEISPLACQIIQKRGVNKVENIDFFEFDTDQKFDTILLMMNGIGFVSSLNGLRDFLDQSHYLLNDNGAIIFDSTLLGDDHKLWCVQNQKNFGQVDYQMIYNEFVSDTFHWLYIDYNEIAQIAKEHGFDSQLSYINDKDEYVAMLTKK